MIRTVRGFTLIEVIVALGITALIAVSAYTELSVALKARETLRAEEDRLIGLQRFFDLIGRDIRHAISRPVFNEFGEQESAMIGRPDELLRLVLTRGGWENFANAPRSNLQRVSWWLDDGILRRAYWPVLDRAGELPMIEQPVLEGVSELELRFLASADVDADDAWRLLWPGDEVAQETLPLAVEVTVELEDWGSATRLFLSAG